MFGETCHFRGAHHAPLSNWTNRVPKRLWECVYVARMASTTLARGASAFEIYGCIFIFVEKNEIKIEKCLSYHPSLDRFLPTTFRLGLHLALDT